jgi:hypothetical protein
MNFKHSVFYFGHVVTQNNCYINFNEGGAELTATLALGTYTLTGLCSEVARAMTWAGSKAYDCTVNRSTRIVAISCASSFTLLFGSGTNAGASCAGLIGFASSDGQGTSFAGTTPSGEAYYPQAPISKYTPFKHWRGASDAAVNVSATGRATVISFGQVERMRCNLSPITDLPMGGVIGNNPSSVSEALAFMDYITQKNPIEFMFDRNDPETFDQCVLESTKDSKMGISFELYEGLGKGIKGIYETDTLTFRKIT